MRHSTEVQDTLKNSPCESELCQVEKVYGSQLEDEILFFLFHQLYWVFQSVLQSSGGTGISGPDIFLISLYGFIVTSSFPISSQRQLSSEWAQSEHNASCDFIPTETAVNTDNQEVLWARAKEETINLCKKLQKKKSYFKQSLKNYLQE